jgi:hypothetical protein
VPILWGTFFSLKRTSRLTQPYLYGSIEKEVKVFMVDPSLTWQAVSLQVFNMKKVEKV